MAKPFFERLYSISITFGVNSQAYGVNSKGYGDNSKGLGDRNLPFISLIHKEEKA